MSGFVESLAPFAQKHGMANGVLPSLILAQAILETGSGSSELAQKANNLFGIKKGAGWFGKVHSVVTSEYRKNAETGEDEKYYITAEFRKYDSYEGAVIDLCKKYVEGIPGESRNRYAEVIGKTSFMDAAQAAKDAGYATDPNYPTKLYKIYILHKLSRYDAEFIEKHKEDNEMAFKVVIDAGHGRNTPGKRTPAGEREWTFNNVVALAAIEELKNYEGVEVLRVDDPTGNTDVPLNTRTNRANAFGGDVYVSIHHNANTGKWGTWTGTETFVMTPASANPASMRLANAVHPKLVGAMGLRNRGIKAANFHVLRVAKMPAILTEGGYMDSTIDIKKMRNNAVLKNAGVAIAQGIAEFGKLKRKSGSSTQDPGSRSYLMRGDTGWRVESLQKYLNDINMAVPQTGVYDADTEAMVKLFQSRKNLEADGFYGPATLAAMNVTLKEHAAKNAPKKYYRVRKSWSDADSQIGAFESFAASKALADEHGGYFVFDENGTVVHESKANAPKEDATVASNDGKNEMPSKSLIPEFKEAVQEGITDGTYPNRAATRAEVAVMIIRAVKLLRKQ